MKLSVSLVFFMLLQHGLSAPTGHHPHSASRAGGPSPHELKLPPLLGLAPTRDGSFSSSAPAGRHPDQDPHSAGHAGTQKLPFLLQHIHSQHIPITGPQKLPHLLEHLGMAPPRSSGQRSDSLQDHQGQNRPPGQDSQVRSRKRRRQDRKRTGKPRVSANKGRYGCTGCTHRSDNDNKKVFGKHIARRHSRPSATREYGSSSVFLLLSDD